MNSNELKELVKKHFSLVDAPEVNVNETMEEVTEETFGEVQDVNKAFTIKFPGDSLQVGDKVTVVTSEGQEMDAPNGEHELADGTKIVTEDSVVKEIMGADGEKALSEEAMAEHDEEDKEEMESVEEVVKEVVEEVIEEVKDEMEEETTVSAEEIVKEIVDAIQEEMGKMKEKMAELEEKVAKYEAMPAAEPTLKSGPAKELDVKPAAFKAFNVEEARNADRIKMALAEMKTYLKK